MNTDDKDINRSPAFQFYPRQFSGDDQVMGMDTDTVGAHILLMCVAAGSAERYRIPCRTDADLHAARMAAHMPSDADWARITKQLLRGAWKVSEDGCWWEQEGLRKSFQRQAEFSHQQRERANKRWGSASTRHASGIDSVSSRHMPNECGTASIGEYRNDALQSSSSSTKNKDLMHSHENDARETLATPLVDSESDDDVPVEDDVEKF